MNYNKQVEVELSQGAVDVLIRDLLKSQDGKELFAWKAVKKGQTNEPEHLELAIRHYERQGVIDWHPENKLFFAEYGVPQERIDLANTRAKEHSVQYQEKYDEYCAFLDLQIQSDELLLREKIGDATPREVLAEEFAERGDFETATIVHLESDLIRCCSMAMVPGLVFEWAKSKGYADVISIVRKRVGELTKYRDELSPSTRHHSQNLVWEYLKLEELTLADYRVEGNPGCGLLFADEDRWWASEGMVLPGLELAARKHTLLANLFRRNGERRLDPETEIFELADLLKDAPSYEEAEVAFKAKY